MAGEPAAPAFRVAAALAVVGLAFAAPALPAQDLDGPVFFRALSAADSLYVAGDRAAAVDLCRKIVERDPLHARAWYRLGRAYE